MKSQLRSARLIGTFFIVSNAAFILGWAGFLDPILRSPDVIGLASVHRTRVVLGASLELLNAFAYLGIAALAFPLLRRRSESLALAFAGFRLLEFAMQIVADLGPLAIITLGPAAAGAGDAAVPYRAAGIGLLALRGEALRMVSVLFGSGALIFYGILGRAGLIPRFISIWGLLGAAIVLASALLGAFGIALPNLGLLMLANELFLGAWLIVKGFHPAAVAALSAKDGAARGPRESV